MPKQSPWAAWKDEYIRQHYPTSPTKAIADHVGISERKVRDRAFSLGVQKRPEAKTMRKSAIFSADMDDFLRLEYPHRTNAELSEMLGIDAASIAHHCTHMGLHKTKETLRRIHSEAMRKQPGRKGQFSKGHKPWNEGMHGYNIALGRSHYRPGNKPPTWVPVGTERWTTPPADKPDASRYLRVKVAEPNVWELKHRHLWKTHRGPIPRGHVVIFKDGDFQNFDLDNLACVHRSDLSISNGASLPIDLVPMFRLARELQQAIEQKANL